MTDTSLTEAEQTALACLRAGTHVIVPVDVLRFLDGQQPDANGVDFIDRSKENIDLRISDGKIPRRFWWRRYLTPYLEAAQEGK